LNTEICPLSDRVIALMRTEVKGVTVNNLGLSGKLDPEKFA